MNCSEWTESLQLIRLFSATYGRNPFTIMNRTLTRYIWEERLWRIDSLEWIRLFKATYERKKQFRTNQITRINPTFPHYIWEEERLWWIDSLLMNQTLISATWENVWTESLEWIRIFNATWEDRLWRIDSVMNQTVKHYIVYEKKIMFRMNQITRMNQTFQLFGMNRFTIMNLTLNLTLYERFSNFAWAKRLWIQNILSVVSWEV